jgi:xanthine/uracil permease
VLPGAWSEQDRSRISGNDTLNNKIVAFILFALAAVMLVLGWIIQGLPPAVTGIGFAVIGYHILRTK